MEVDFSLLSHVAIPCHNAIRKEDNTLSQNKNQYLNHLSHYRRRMRFTQTHVLHLMGRADRTKLWKLEAGESLPTLLTVLKLSAILRAPVEFLYHDLYASLREDIRKREERIPVGQQGVLPIFTP